VTFSGDLRDHIFVAIRIEQITFIRTVRNEHVLPLKGLEARKRQEVDVVALFVVDLHHLLLRVEGEDIKEHSVVT